MKKFEDQNHEDLEAFFLSAQRALPAPSDQLRERVLQNAQALMAMPGQKRPIARARISLFWAAYQIFGQIFGLVLAALKAGPVWL